MKQLGAWVRLLVYDSRSVQGWGSLVHVFQMLRCDTQPTATERIMVVWVAFCEGYAIIG